MTLRVLRADRDRHEWLDAWSQTPAREPFAHPDYCALFVAPGVVPLCAVGTDGGNSVMFPFLLRDLAVEPWTTSTERRQDIAVPAGYGGAYLRSPLTTSSGAEFWGDFAEWAAENRVVCADARISLYRDEILPMAGWVETRSCDNIVIDLRIFREQGIGSFARSLRRNIRQAGRVGVSAKATDSPGAFKVFQKLYLHTMDRVAAIDYYYFPELFFERLQDLVDGGLAKLFLARGPDSAPMCGALVLLGQTRAYEFLAGGNEDARRLHGHEFLRSVICDWLAEKGSAEFVLGGGNNPDDDLFWHKQKYAGYGRHAYYVGSQKYDTESYVDLLRLRQRYQHSRGQDSHVARRFPEYR